MKVTSTAICGSDLHLLDGYVPTMEKGDILGHEFMGEVVEVGPGVDADKLRVGDRVVVPFPIACGACDACQAELYSCCENTNPNAGMAEKMFGHPVAGIFGYSHLTGGYAGGQAEYARVPFADVGPLKIEARPHRRAGAVPLRHPAHRLHGRRDVRHRGRRRRCRVGRRPVGQFAMDSARVLGAAKVIAIDKEPYRLRDGRRRRATQTINFDDADVRSGAAGADGRPRPGQVHRRRRAGGHPRRRHVHAYDRVKQAIALRDRPAARPAAGHHVCRSGGIVSVIGVYGGFIDKFPAGAWMNRALTLRTGQCHVQRYMRPLLERIESGEIDPTRIITHRLPLAEAPHGYDIFKHKQDDCEKVVLKA